MTTTRLCCQNNTLSCLKNQYQKKCTDLWIFKVLKIIARHFHAKRFVALRNILQNINALKP